MSAWTWNTSVSAASNGCCHLVEPVETWISSGLTRTWLPPAPFSHRTVPVSSQSTPSSRPISWGDRVDLLYWVELLRAVTWSPGSEVSLPRTSSVIPSAK